MIWHFLSGGGAVVVAHVDSRKGASVRNEENTQKKREGEKLSRTTDFVFHVIERIWGVDGETDENDVSFGIS